MRNNYNTPEIEFVRLKLSNNILGESTWVPEETLVEETVDIDFD